MEKKIKEIPFGAKDSELHKFEYTIPEGYEARIENWKVIVKKKESEDERIRKALIHLINEQDGFLTAIDGISVKDIIAYLEKQKDKVVEFDHDREQQPAKEDGPFDEDKFLEGELAAFLQNYDKEYDDDAAVSDVAIHFYELGKKMKQKPAEWSEEDEHCLHQLILFCENCMQQDSEAIRCATWLKSLRPQSVQDKFDEAMHVADKFEEGYKAGVYDTKAKSWKPSEEQMKALERWLLDNRFKGDSRYVYPIFESLYNDLKNYFSL